MAIFGQRRPLFGQIPGLDMMQSAAHSPMQMNNPPMGMAMQQPMQQNKPGFFSKGGGWVDALGAFGDAFSGNGAVYANQKVQRSRMMREQEMAEQKRQQDRENFLFEENYKRQNPMPINNDTVNDLNWYKNLSEEDRKLYHQMKPVTGLRADGTPYAYNPYELNQPRPNVPKPGTIEDDHEFLGGDPSDPKSWRPVAGGGVRNGTSGF